MEKKKYIFENSFSKNSLKKHAVRGGAVSVFSQGCGFILRMVSTIILARLLSPADFGLIAMATVISNFAAVFKDIGLSMATVQKADIKHDQISTLFWINVVVGICITSSFIAIAPLVSWFYGQPELLFITMILGVTFIFAGLTTQHKALLTRHMKFFILGVIEVLSMLAAVVVAIVAGLCGSGYWALVLFHLSLAMGSAIGMWMAMPWRPGLPKRNSGVKEMLAFGGNITGFNFINYFARNLDDILIGRYVGSAALGLYRKAYDLLMFPIQQLTHPIAVVAIPALSQVQNKPELYCKYYLKAISSIAFISMPVVVLLYIYSIEIILILLGEQWVEAAPIFKILAITAFIQPVSTTVGVVLVSLGQSGRFLRYGILNSIAVACCFVVGIRWDAIGVASAYAVANYIILFPSLWYCFHLTPVSIVSFCKAIGLPVIASLVMGVIMSLGYSLLSGGGNILGLFAEFAIGLTVYLLVGYLLPGGRQIFRDFLGYLKLVFVKVTDA